MGRATGVRLPFSHFAERLGSCIPNGEMGNLTPYCRPGGFLAAAVAILASAVQLNATRDERARHGLLHVERAANGPNRRGRRMWSVGGFHIWLCDQAFSSVKLTGSGSLTPHRLAISPCQLGIKQPDPMVWTRTRTPSVLSQASETGAFIRRCCNHPQIG